MTEGRPFTLGNEEKFQALIARFQDHTETLRVMTGFDLQIFGGYITLQLAVGAWLAEHPVNSWPPAFGLLILDVSLAGLTAKLLFNNYMRRTEVVGGLRNVIDALQYREPGIYLPATALDAATVFRPWWWWYLIGVVGGFLGILVIVVAPFFP